jgi:formylmethanofuran dehydrogenase subunit E
MKEREDNGYINECSECGVLLLREEDVRIYDDMVVCPLCYDML